MRFSRQRPSASPAVSPGDSVTTSRAIASLTRSIRPPFPAQSNRPAGPAHPGPVSPWYKGGMAEKLNELLADKATLLVRENFTGVRAEWWWERRMGGGIEICQELDPETMAREVSQKTGRQTTEVRRVLAEELGLEDDEPVVLTFEIAGEVPVSEAAGMLQDRSSSPEGLALGLYRQVEDATRSR